MVPAQSRREGDAPRVLVFEPQHGGHHPSFVRMLAMEIVRVPRGFRPVFAVTRELVTRLRVDDGFDLAGVPDAELLPIDASAAAACEQGTLFARSFARWRLLRHCLAAARASHATAPFFDPLQLPLAMRSNLPGGATVSGILFRPSVHEIYRTKVGRGNTERLRDLRKLALYGLMLRNPSLSFLLTLDPYFPAFAARRFRGGALIATIADPALQPRDEGGAIGPDLARALDSDRLVFALFGALTERKGISQSLDALWRLPPAVRDRIRLVIAGEPDAAVGRALEQLPARLAGLPGGPAACAILPRRLTTAELSHVVRRADVVLAPYQRFVGSSGVLTWAASARRPVLAQDYGLVGALVRAHALGLTTDAADPQAIASAIAEFAAPGGIATAVARADWDGFLAGRHERDFGATYAAALEAALVADRRP